MYSEGVERKEWVEVVIVNWGALESFRGLESFQKAVAELLHCAKTKDVQYSTRHSGSGIGKLYTVFMFTSGRRKSTQKASTKRKRERIGEKKKYTDPIHLIPISFMSIAFL